jgi:cytochrome P450
VAVTLSRAIYHLTCRVLSRPLLLKIVFACVRRIRPIAIVGGNVIVTKHDDVREVLHRFDDFTLAEYTQSKMLGGSFLLSIDWREQHTRERELLKSVVLPAHDLQWIQRLAAEECETLIGRAVRNANGRHEIDVAGELAENVALNIVSTYFGVTAVPAGSFEMARLLRRLAGLILLEPPEGTKEWFASRKAILDLTDHLVHLIKAKSAQVAHGAAAPLPNDDLLTRLVKRMHASAPRPPWFTEDWIRRYLTGLAVFGNATISQTVAHSLDQLLARPDALRRAKQAAGRLAESRPLAGEVPGPCKGQEAACRMQQFIYEALRFRPMLPLLARYSPRETMLAKGTSRQRRVPAGARVIAGPLAAMFDPETFERPWHFCSARPLEDYIHFGYGPHVCVGKYIADAQIIEIVRAVLLLDDLQRAPGRRGRVQYDGPAVDSLHVTFVPR